MNVPSLCNLFGKRCLALLWGAFFVLASAGPAQAQLTAGSGSVEFVAAVKSGTLSFLKPQTVFSAVSSDGKERVDAIMAGADVIVIRDVHPCLRLSARFQDIVRPGVPHRIAIRWRGVSASAAIDGGKEEALEPSRIDQLPIFARSAPSAGSQGVEVLGLVFDKLPALAESPPDRQFVAQAKCFNPSAAIKSSVVDTYRGVELRGFETPEQLAQARKWIGAMTPEMAAAVKSISIAAEGSETWRGLSLPGARAMLLRPESVGEPSVVFHEGAHLLDGAHGWRDSRDWGIRFMGRAQGSRSFSPGVVGHMDASAPGEQLADFVGRAREESLGQARTRICAHDSDCAEKLRFLVARGYLSEADAQALVSQKTALTTLPIAAVSRQQPKHAPPSANPYYKTETIVVPPGVSSIDIVLDARHFRPIDIYRDGGLTVSPTWRGCKAEDVMNRLTRKRPAAIIAEPPLKGTRYYGYFDFGTKKVRRHYFALDELADGSIEMLFDMNANGRLDDDGTARPSMGKFKAAEKGYATLIEFPWSTVMDNPPWEGYFKLWFVSNPFEWAISGFTKSSRTQLIGAISLSGQTYDLIIADSAESDNDGDLSNDGLCIRKAAQKAICYKDAEARSGILIDGKRYNFNVRYR